MNYITVTFFVSPEFTDILIAELSEIGFDIFLENETGFQASIEKNLYSKDAIEEIISRYKEFISPLSYTEEEVEKKNWNEEWEKNYDPIIVSDACIVKASFHQIEKKYPYEIIVNPKMSFGTGHHETTFLMLQKQLTIDHTDKKVMDLGCGTGILAIMANKLGAKEIVVCDIDEWCVENSSENFGLNNCDNIKIFLGTVENIPDHGPQDIILANINRNVLLEEIPQYGALLKNNGYLLLSGFYERDIEDIKRLASKNQLKYQNHETKKDWAVVLFQKCI